MMNSITFIQLDLVSVEESSKDEKLVLMSVLIFQRIHLSCTFKMVLKFEYELCLKPS